VDLRDGNQALEPMDTQETEDVQCFAGNSFKQIEVGFPSARKSNLLFFASSSMTT
jgi:isopropylmalate/homocitrate/citramalate synthase